MNFDLRSLIKVFPNVTERLYGMPQRLEDIEKYFEPVRKGKEKLTIKHLETIKDSDGKYWHFLKWWNIPDKISDDDLASIPELSHPGPHNDKLIIKLNSVFKNIEVVSCILRFIAPSYYGIISPPVENLLRFHGSNYVQKYLEYLKNLEELKDEFHLERAADVDVALWTLSKIMSEPILKYDSSYKHYINDFENSINPVKQMITKNALKELWSSEINLESYLDRANILCNIDTKIAGIIAGQALEFYIKKLCDRHEIKIWFKDKRGRQFYKISELLEKLSTKRAIIKDDKEEMEKLWKSRNEFMHEFEDSPSKEKIDEMIRKISNFIG